MNQTQKDTKLEDARLEPRHTAAERYAAHQQDIGALLDLIGEELRAHAEAAATKPSDWSAVGDLSHIRDALKDILVFVHRHDWSEVETSSFIEDHLEAMREPGKESRDPRQNSPSTRDHRPAP